MQRLTFPTNGVTKAKSVPDYKAYGRHNFHQIPQLDRLTAEDRFAIEVVSQVLPFKANSYVIDELIDWARVPDDPIFRLTFPQVGMLKPEHFNTIASLIRQGANQRHLQEASDTIRLELNPHPAGQLELNRPLLNGAILDGMQHKYRETVLFFPSQGQTCHAYCTFCFRWPQFVGMNALKFAMRQATQLVAYLHQHPEVTDVLITGGDPLIMKSEMLATYLLPLLENDLPQLQTIRIGSKALGFWPYRFLTDSDAEALLALLRRLVQAGKHVTLMAHFTHPRELHTTAVRQAIARIRETGVQIRTQSPLLAQINDDPDVWAAMWQEQVALGCVPYYMFVVRNTGAQHHFAVPLERAWNIFREAYQQVSGIARTVRGPSMSTNPGKVEIQGITEINGEKLFMLRFLQGRNPDWVLRPFFAKYDPEAIWLDDLQPAFGTEQFFFAAESGYGEHATF